MHPILSLNYFDSKMFQIILCCTILGLFSGDGRATPVLRRQCRAGVCDDRPLCPQSPCRCIYPSQIDCSLYYQCVQGKPYQYRCSSGLLFNEETLTCDYDFNVNCSIGKNTRSAESTTGDITTSTIISIVTDTPTTIGNNAISDHSIRFTELSTETSSNDVSEKYSTEIYQTSPTGKVHPTEYSKSTSINDETTPDSSENTRKTSDSPSVSSSDISDNTTYSNSTDFITEIIYSSSTIIESKESEITISSSSTKTREPKTTISVFTSKESEEPKITNPSSTTKESEEPITTISTSTATNNGEPETTKFSSTTKDGEELETTNSVFTGEKSEEPEITSPSSTTKQDKEQETTISESISTERKEPETTISTSTATERKEPETTISTSTATERKEPETTISTSTATERKEPETTIATSTATERKEPETTIFRYTTKTTSKAIPTNVSTRVTAQSVTTEEIQPEVTTDLQNRNWTCPSRFGLFPDESDCNKFYHCSQWKPYHQRCPSNLHFNPVLTVCDWPETAGCEQQMTSRTIETAATTEPETHPNISCDCDFCELPIPGDCTSYIMCTNNSTRAMTCGQGLYFNAMTETCDLEDNVLCENNIECPESTGRFPYPNSCVHYMECENLKLTVRRCPKGMNFDKDKHSCSSGGSCEDVITTLTSHQYSDPTHGKVSEASSESFTTDSTGQNIFTERSKSTISESNFTFSVTTNTETTDSKFTSENATKSDELFSTRGSDRPGDYTTIIISTDDTAEDTSTIISTINPKSNATTHLESTVTDTFTLSDEVTSIGTAFTDETSTNAEITSFISKVSEDLSIGTESSTNTPDETETTSPLTTIVDEISINTKITLLPTAINNKTSTERILPSAITPNEEMSTTVSDIETTTPSTGETKVDVTESLSTSSNYDILSTNSSSLEPFSTKSNFSDYSSKMSTTISPGTEFNFSTEIYEKSSTSTDSSSFEISSLIADFSTDDPENFTNASKSRSTTAIPNDFTDDSTMKLSNSSTENSENFTFISTKQLITIIDPSTERSSTEVPSVISELTQSSVNTISNITEEVKINTSPDVSNIPVSTIETSTNLSFTCPSRFGLFPDSENCFRFYHCSHWLEHHKWCPSGLHFNPTLQVCDWPYRAGCEGSSVLPTSETTQPKEDDIIYNDTCDCECCFYPHKTDCSKYMLCLDGILHRGQCAEGLLFNPLDNNCDVSEKVTCPQTSSVCQTQNGVFPHPTVCTAFYRCSNKNPVLEHCPENKHFKASGGECVEPCDANCDKTLNCTTLEPTPGGSNYPVCTEDDDLYPNEKDCSSYYQCAEGHAYFVKCPDGLHFNSNFKVCEQPCDANCDFTINCPSSMQLASSKMLKIPSPQCPRSNGLFPVTEDCSAYYMCSNGKAHLLHCPPGLHYSTKDETCEMPCNAQCDKKTDCTRLKSEKPKENILFSSSHLPLSFLCKTVINGSLPNPKNCTSFYKCSNGQPRLLPCPRGLHYDPEDKKCKNPCLAGCDFKIKCPSEIPSPRGKCSCENCYLQDPTDCSAYLFCGQGVLTKGYCPQGTLFDRSLSECRNSSEVMCEEIGDPAMCHKRSGTFPHPGNCHRFIRCENSVAHIMECENGLEFDPDMRACANPKGYCGQIVKDPLCKKATGQFAHPNDSSLFYQCENGTKYLKSCSSPLVYDDRNQVCDWPHNVQDKSKEEAIKTKELRNEIPQNVSTSSSRAKACEVVPGVTCPCACRVTTYDDCDSFYHCRKDGTACKRRCPQGLFFNRQKMVCDLPQNVECRDFFFATLRRLKSRNSVKTWLKSPS